MHQYNTKKKKGKKKANSLYLVLGRQIDKTRQDKTGSLIRNNKNHYNYNRHRDEEEEEQKTKKREKYLILYIKICIHTSYHIIYSFLFIPHPSSLIPLSLSLFPPSFLLFLPVYLLKKDTHTASHSAYKTASESVRPEFLSQPISLAFPPNEAQQ